MDAKSHREDSAGSSRHTVTCPRLDLLYQTVQDCARGGNKKVTVCGSAAVPAAVRRASSRAAPSETRSGQPARSNPCSVAERDRSRSIPDSHRRLRTDTHSRTRVLDPGVKPISWRAQLRFIALGYAAVFAVAAGLLSARYLQELNHPADVAAYGGMYADGDLLLGCAAHSWVNVHG